MRIPLSLALLALGLGVASPGLAQQEDRHPLAPDGRPGLGGDGDARSYGRYFRSPSESELAFLCELEELEPDVLVLAEMVRRDYRRRGYFRLLGWLADQRLEELHRCFVETGPGAVPLLAEGGEAADAFAEMFLDLRFRARLELLESLPLELREVEAGLALLRATQDGFVELKDTEARAIAERVDLAAALLRAIRSDLEALRERGDDRAPGSPDPAWMAELIGLTKIRDEAQRSSAYLALGRKVEARLEKLRGALFTPRLREKLAVQLTRRAAALESARQRGENTRRYLLVSPEGDDPPREVQQMAKFRRYQHALSEALTGLSYDPLDEELTYWVGFCTDYLFRTIDARQWYDRYLAMRGIRVDRNETFAERRLTEREERAKEAVLSVFGAAGPSGR